MIIQCKQCRTKFRFDDAKIAEEGVWVRCNRCQHVFFQEPPRKSPSFEPAADGDEPLRSGPAAENAKSRLSFEPASPPPGKIPQDEDLIGFLRDVRETEKADAGEAKRDFIDTDRAEEEIAERFEEWPREEEARPLPARKKSRAGMFALWTLLVVVAIPAVLYFVVFPPLGERLLKAGGQGWQSVLSTLGFSGPAERLPVTAQVKLQDVRQRILENYILGPVRVVEGKAVNGAEFPISRVQVKAEILDAYAVVLSERVCYAGNILNDDELVTMTEEEIKIRLSLPEGRDQSNDRVEPGGKIPFMVVFSGDPKGMMKTVVKIVGAERLL